jgi:hypothetical protein
MKFVRPYCVLLVLALTGGTPSALAQESAAAGRTPGQEVVQKRHYRLEMYQGKGYVFCEALLNEAKQLHPKGEYLPLEPILSWEAIFGIRGVAEPPWTEVDPLQHEALFAKLYQLYEEEDNRNVHPLGNLNQLDIFFARGRYPCQICNLPPEERRLTTLDGYRNFAKSGGRMRAYDADIGVAGVANPVRLVQYEYPTPPPWSFSRSGWYGLTFFAKPDLSDLTGPVSMNRVTAGLHRRLVQYRGKPHVLTIEYGTELSVKYVPAPYWECRIDSRHVGPKP